MSYEQRSIFDWAVDYVGDPDSWGPRGRLATTFLKELGLRTDHNVLEAGCGCLSAGIPLISYLDANRYVGLEPNGWLVEAARQQFPTLDRLFADKQPRFYWRSDFDGQDARVNYDFCFAHSVLSHAAAWQLPLFLTNVRRLLKPNGIILASVRLGETNTDAAQWVYPGNSFFTRETVVETAERVGFHVKVHDGFKRRMSETCPSDIHDWVVFKRKPLVRQAFRPFVRDDLEQMAGFDGDGALAVDTLLALGAGAMVEVEE